MGLALTFSIAVRDDGGEEWWARVFAGVVLALFPVFALSCLAARGSIPPRSRWLATAIVLVAAGTYAGWGFDPDRHTEVWRAAMLVGAGVLSVALVPAAEPRGSAPCVTFWRFNALLLARTVSVIAYGAALFLALAGAVAAVSSLFDLRTPEHLYADLAGWTFWALVPCVIAGGIDWLVTPAEGEDPALQPLVPALGVYLYLPVLTLYLLILLAYTGKVAVTGEFPKNLLSPIVLLAGLIGFVGSIYLEPILASRGYGAVSRLVRVLPAVLLLLLPLAAWALWIRREQYGWTEFRYLRMLLLLALGVLAVWGTVALLRRRPPLLAAVPAVLGAALLLGAVGPWSASAVARRNQQARLRGALASAGMLRTDGPSPRFVLPAAGDSLLLDSAAYGRITGAAAYLSEAHGPGSLRGILPDSVARLRAEVEVAEALRIRTRCEGRWDGYVTGMLPVRTPVPGLRGGTAYRVDVGSGGRAGGTGGADLELRLAEQRLTVSAPNDPAPIAVFDLRPLAAAAAPRDACPLPGGAVELTGRLALLTASGTRVGTAAELLVTTVGIRRRDAPEADSTPEILNLQGILLMESGRPSGR